MFAALRKRRLVEFRYAQYLAGIGASETYNMAVAQAGGSKWRNPVDYVGVERGKGDKFAELRQNILALFSTFAKGMDKPKLRELLITRISSSGRYTKEEITGLIREMFPDWEN